VAAQLRVYRRRIRSVQSTKKITKAMELIAASRIVRAQQRMLASRPYTEELTRALGELSKDSSVEHPLLTGVDEPRRTGILLITSDRGLAGGYNANAIRTANELASRLEDDGREVDRYVIGRKGVAYYNFRRIALAGTWTGFSEQPDFEHARPAAQAVVDALVAGSAGTVTTDDGTGDAQNTANPAGPADAPPGIDELYVVFTHFVNSVTQTPQPVLVAPVKDIITESQASAADSDEDTDTITGGVATSVATDDRAAAGGGGAAYDFEPQPEQLIAALVPRYVIARVFSALLEAAASESAARRRAMQSASDNADELIRTYTRMANEARQAEITQEISEIVGGADALAATGSED
jgi:F-type H+-transporting ATPase subunit gamma